MALAAGTGEWLVRETDNSYGLFEVWFIYKKSGYNREIFNSRFCKIKALVCIIEKHFIPVNCQCNYQHYHLALITKVHF